MTTFHGLSANKKGIATAADVARLAGVSQPTVSRALADNPLVSSKTRKLVQDAAAILGYRPNAMARSLSLQRSGLIAVVCGSMDNPFYWDMVRQTNERLQTLDLQVLLFSVGPNDNFDDILHKVLQYQVDGLIALSAVLSSRAITQCKQAGLPVILFNRHIDDGNLNAVCCDNLAGGRDVARLLIQTGHKSFGYISGTEDTSTNRDRFKGFTERLAEAGFPMPAVEHGDYTYMGGREAVKRLILQGDKPDAIFCANDIMAIGALDGLRIDLKLNVPEDISVVGFDDIAMAGWSGVELTTVQQQGDRLIGATLDILKANIENPDMEPVFHLEPGRLIIRKTVRLGMT